MSRLVNPISETGEWAFLEAHWPGYVSAPIGILLRDRRQDRLHVKMDPKWWKQLPDSEEADLWREMAQELEQQAQKVGAAQVLTWLENTASHTLRISTRQEIPLTNAPATLDHLYQQHLGVSRQGSERARTLRLFWNRIGTFLFPGELLPHWRVNSWWAQAIVAATLLLMAAWAGRQVPAPRFAPPILTETIQELREFPVLPLGTGAHYQPALWNLNAKLLPPPAVHRARNRKRVVTFPLRRHFQMNHVVVRPHVMQLARLDVPVLPVEPETQDIAWAPNIVQLPPSPPPYRARHNKLIRAMALVAAPFRLLAK